jgi:hypothetical protein
MFNSAGINLSAPAFAILVWPTTLNMLAPAYKRAAAACGDLAQKLGLTHRH